MKLEQVQYLQQKTRSLLTAIIATQKGKVLCTEMVTLQLVEEKEEPDTKMNELVLELIKFIEYLNGEELKLLGIQCLKETPPEQI